MNIPVISSQQPQVAQTQNQPLVLKEGQMVHGQIKQLFPGQKAEIQIGNQTMIAKLEVPMKAGDAYYFQVKSVQPELQLKMIAGPTNAAEGQTRQLNSLMEAMQLPKTAEMSQLLSFVLKNKIPMTREGLLQAEILFKSVPQAMRAEALASIQKLVELKLPLTETAFRSVLGVQTKEGLHTVLASLRSTMTTDLSVSPQAREAITASLDKMAKPFAEATGSALLGKALSTILDRTAPAETRFAAVQLLKNANILPERISLANVQQVLTSLLTNEPTAMPRQLQVGVQLNQPASTPTVMAQVPPSTTQEIVQALKQITQVPTTLNAQITSIRSLLSADTSISADNKAALTTMLDQATTSKPTAESSQRFVQQFSEAIVRMTAENTVSAPFRGDAQQTMPKDQLLTLLGQTGQQATAEKLEVLVRNAERADNQAIQKLLQTAENAVANAVEGKAVKEAIQSVVRSFGLNYESALLGKNPDISRLAESLKPQLLALMQDPTVSQAVRDSAEAVVTRMNGPLLMSGENGAQHQLVMQVPLEFFGKRIDATLQWNGRMKENGKIDPDFARILFYLDLESLEKTIIDMQVQNRVVSITVFNADPAIQTIGAMMQERLKEGLTSTGYQLSGVFFKNFHEEKVVKQPISRQQVDSQGVDFRI